MALSAEDIARRAKNNTLTFRDALEYGIAHPITSKGKESKAAATRMRTLLNTGLKQMNIDPDMPFSELANPEIYKRFAITRDEKGKKESASYVYAGQTLEYALDPVFQKYGVRGFTVDIGDDLEKALYPHIFGERGISGLTQRSGQGQARPMQGTITRKEMDDIYASGYAKIDAAGEPKAQIIKDGMDYHRATANRLDHLFGTGGIQKKDISFLRDKSNNIVKVTVAEKIITSSDDHKGRFQMTYPADSRLGELLIRNYESSPTQYVFDLSDGEYETAFDTYLGPEWLKYKDKLPFLDLIEGQTSPETAARVSSASVVRSAIPRMLNAEFKVPADLRKGIMGQKGGDTLNRFYEGIVVDEELGSIAEMYAFGEPRQFSGITGAGQNQQAYQGFTFELSEEARKEADERAIAEARAGKEEANDRAATAKLKAAKGEKEFFDWLESEEGQKYQQQKREEEINKATIKGEADAARASARKSKIDEERARTERIVDPEPDDDDDDVAARFQDLAQQLADMKALTKVEVVDTKPLSEDVLEGELLPADEDTQPNITTPLIVDKAITEADKALKELPPPQAGGSRIKDTVLKTLQTGFGAARKAVPFIRMAESAKRAYDISKSDVPMTPDNIAKEIGRSTFGFDAFGMLSEGIEKAYGASSDTDAGRYLDNISKKPQPRPSVTGPSMNDQYRSTENLDSFLRLERDNSGK